MRAHNPGTTSGADKARATAPRAAAVRPADVTAAPGGRSPLSLRALQRSIGNAAVSRLIEEDRHQHGAGCGHPQDAPAVQRSAVHDVLRGGGRPLDAPLREEMESRLGADFSDVRLHSGATAQRSASEIGARAFTSGNHVVIGSGGADKHTLAHELTHVIQQRSGPVAGTDNGSGLSISDPSDRFERAAEANATRVMSGPLPAAGTAAGTTEDREATAGQAAGTVQRAPDWKNKPTKAALKALKTQHPGDPLVYTLHHIAPKSKLGEFSAMLTAAQRAQVVAALRPHAPTAFTSGSSSLQAVSDALKNLPANYAVGPEPKNRTDDPGAGIDPNYDSEGAITPRSEELEQLNTLIIGITSSPPGTPVSATELQTFIAHAVAACQAHNRITGGGVGLDRNRVQWHGDPTTQNSRRTGTLSPLA